MDRHIGPAGQSGKDSGPAVRSETWWVGQPAEPPGWAAAEQRQAADVGEWWVDHPALAPPAVPAAVPVPESRRPRYGRLTAALLLLLLGGLAAGVSGWHPGAGEGTPVPAGVELAAPQSSDEPSEAALAPQASPESAAPVTGTPAPPARKEARRGIEPRLAPTELVAVAPGPAPAQPAATPRGEASLLQELAGVPEVGLTPPELRPLVETWMGAFAATNNDPNSTPLYEPVPLLLQRPDLAQLPLRQGWAARLSGAEAAHLEALSQRLHGHLERLTAANCGACHTADLRLDAQRLATHASEAPADLTPLRELLQEEREGKRPAWRRPEAVATLQQVLMPESAPYRRLLVELLDEVGDKKAVAYLAQRAVFDLSPEVRRRAVEALRKRPREQYRKALLAGLRYPWPPAAEHAAEALLALKDTEAVPHLVALLKETGPSTPVKLKNGRYVVPEVVRLRHAFNCLTCHPPAAKPGEPAPGAVPGINFTRVITLTKTQTRVVPSGEVLARKIDSAIRMAAIEPDSG